MENYLWPAAALPGGRLRQVAHNKLDGYYRRAARRPTVTLEHLQALLEADGALTSEQQALRQEDRRRLGAALQQLEPHQRQVLYLRFSLGLRCAQIGLVMGKLEDENPRVFVRGKAFSAVMPADFAGAKAADRT